MNSNIKQASASHLSNQRSLTAKSAQSGLDEDSFFEEEESANFALRNQNFQLKSVINKLQYDKNKNTISYENTIKQLKQKYSILERILAEKNEKQDKNNNSILDILQAKCQFLTQQNQQLKKDLHNSAEGYRLTPNFKQLKHNDSINNIAMLIAQVQKPQNFSQFQKTLEAVTQKKLEELKSRISALQKQNSRLKEQSIRTQREKQDIIQTITKQNEEHYNNIIKFKDKTIEDLKASQVSQSLQLQQAKKSISQLSYSQSDSSAQQKKIKFLVSQGREKDTKVAQLQQTINKLQMENSRVKIQKSKIENELKYYENERKDNDSKKKVLQQQLFRLQNELNQAKSASYNQKFQIKKQLNTLKCQAQDEKMKLKMVIQQKILQSKRLKDSAVALSQQNQQIKQKELNFIKNMDQLIKQNNSLRQKTQNLIRQLQLSEKKSNNIDKDRSALQQKQNKITLLKQQLMSIKEDSKKSSNKQQQVFKQQSKYQEQINLKQQIIQILKIEKEEQLSKQKSLESKIKQLQSKLNEKSKAMSGLQEEIRDIKEDNKQLQLANDELKQKVDTLKRIREDVEAINSQLKKQKLSLQQKKKQQQRLKVQKKNSNLFPDQPNINNPNNPIISRNKNKQVQSIQYIPDHLANFKSMESNDGKELLIDLVKQLKIQNYQLQAKLGQVQNQRDRKGVDLNIKQSQLKNLKNESFKPKDVIFQPMIQVTKKNQFNAVFFQNKVMELQKEIGSIRSMKQKECEQFKKSYRKQMQEKYLNQIKKQKAYIHQLQKKNNIINQRLQQQRRNNQILQEQAEDIQKQNFSVKVQYSDNLQQLNRVLQKCKHLQQKYRQLELQSKKSSAYLDEYHNVKYSYDNLLKNFQQQSLILKNANEQIRKLNELLMTKQSELKGAFNRSRVSPNNSFIKSNRNQEKQLSMRSGEDNEKTLEGDAIRMWAQRRPTPWYSRI